MTDTAKHTAGPWKYHDDDTQGGFYGQYYVTSPATGGRVVARIQGIGSETAANTRLIAAAPELLVACKQAMTIMDHAGGFSDTVILCGAAIAKAERGGQ